MKRQAAEEKLDEEQRKEWERQEKEHLQIDGLKMRRSQDIDSIAKREEDEIVDATHRIKMKYGQARKQAEARWDDQIEDRTERELRRISTFDEQMTRKRAEAAKLED